MKKRIGEIDFWKIVFAIIVVLFHSRSFDFYGLKFFASGRVAVEFFFIVSGFLMAKSSAKERTLPLGTDTAGFMWRKIKALIPEFYVAWVIAFLVENSIKSTSLTRVARNGISSIWELLFVWNSGISGFRANKVGWYISCMLLAMLVLYPILRKWRNTFLHVIAPVGTIFIYGYMYQMYGALTGPNNFEGFIYRGTLRAFAGVMLGCLCYAICEKIKEIDFTLLSRILLTLLELLCFSFTIFMAFVGIKHKLDYVCVLCFGIAITIVFSGKNVIYPIFNNRVCYFLGKFSLSLYLSHGFWAHALASYFKGQSYFSILPIYLLLSLVTAIFVYVISLLLRKIAEKYGKKIKAIFIKPKDAV